MFEKYVEKYIRENQAPCLRNQIIDFQKKRPFEGKRILDATPIYFNTMLKYEAIIAGGGHLEVFCNNKNFDYRVIGILQQLEIPVHINTDNLGSFDLIFDCGAELKKVNSVRGRVELTASGIAQYKNCNKFVVSVDNSRLKEYETRYGTADGLIRALKKLNLLQKDSGEKRNAIVFGFGKVGKGICRELEKQNYKIFVVEKPGNVVCDYPCFYTNQKEIIFNAIQHSELVISAVGSYNAVGSMFDSCKAIFPESARFINMGYEQDFVGWENAENSGYPLNFILEEPTQTQYIDPVMALSNACGVRFLEGGPYCFKPSGFTDKIVLPLAEDEDRIEGDMRNAHNDLPAL